MERRFLRFQQKLIKVAWINSRWALRMVVEIGCASLVAMLVGTRRICD